MIIAKLSTPSVLIIWLRFTAGLSVNITARGDVVAGRPFTLGCRITRPTGDDSPLFWSRDVGQSTSRIYATRNCTPSILLSNHSSAGLSGGCHHVNGEEVYTVTIQNVTEDTGRGRWLCQFGLSITNVTLDVKVMVTRVTLTNRPGRVLAGDSISFTCISSPSKPPPCIRAYIRNIGNVRKIDKGGCNQDSSSVQITTRTLTFTASEEENGAELYCNASNSVTDPPVSSQVYTLHVQFGPDSIQLQAVIVTEDSIVIFICNTSESDPPAVLSWYNNNNPIATAEISEVSSQRGPNHGYLTTQRYTLRFDGYQDGDVIRCEAQRPGNGSKQRVSSNVTLNFNLSTGMNSALVVPLAGGLSGAIVVVGITLLVVVIIRKRKSGGRSSGETEKTRRDDVSVGVKSTIHYENMPGSGISANEDEHSPSVCHARDDGNVDRMPSSLAADSGVPAGLYSVVDKKKGTGFSVTRHVTPTFAGRSVGYEDVDPIPNSPATGSDVPPGLNTVADKTKDAQLAPPVYAQVNKPQKAPKPAKVPEGPTYAEVNKTGKKGTTKTGRTTTDTFTNAAFAGDEVTHYNTGEDGRVKQSRRFGQKKGPRELVYVETEFADTKSTTLRTKSKTSYVSIAFDEKRPPI